MLFNYHCQQQQPILMMRFYLRQPLWRIPYQMLWPAQACSRLTALMKTGKAKARTPLRSLRVEDASKAPLSTGLGGSPLKWLFSHLMGTKSGDKDIKQVKKKKPSAWNICLGDSAVQIGHKNH